MAGDVVRGTVMASGAPVLTRERGGRLVTREEQAIGRDAQIARAVQEEKVALAIHGSRLLGLLEGHVDGVFRDATGAGLAATRRIEDEEHALLCENFGRELTEELRQSLVQVFRHAEAHVVSAIAAATPGRPLPPPRRRIVEVRELSWRERVSGQAVLAYEGVGEESS